MFPWSLPSFFFFSPCSPLSASHRDGGEASASSPPRSPSLPSVPLSRSPSPSLLLSSVSSLLPPLLPLCYSLPPKVSTEAGGRAGSAGSLTLSSPSRRFSFPIPGPCWGPGCPGCFGVLGSSLGLWHRSCQGWRRCCQGCSGSDEAWSGQRGLDLDPKGSPLLSSCLAHTTGVSGCKGARPWGHRLFLQVLWRAKGVFFHPLRTSAELVVLLEGEIDPSSHTAQRLSSAAPCPLWALAEPRPSGIPMGFHAGSPSHTQELGFSANRAVLTDHFQLNPAVLLTSDPCAKDPFSVKPKNPVRFQSM